MKVRSGAQPFEQPLKCACGHVFCHWCTASEILVPIPEKDPDPMIVSKGKNDEVVFGQVCSDCGTCWRAEKLESPEGLEPSKAVIRYLHQTCVCKNQSSTAWFRFRLGSSKKFREGDPNASWQKALERRLERTMTEQAEKFEEVQSDSDCLSDDSSDGGVELPTDCLSGESSDCGLELREATRDRPRK